MAEYTPHAAALAVKGKKSRKEERDTGYLGREGTDLPTQLPGFAPAAHSLPHRVTAPSSFPLALPFPTPDAKQKVVTAAAKF